jgi:phosphohistidine phosphatase
MPLLVLLRHADAEPHRPDDRGRRLSAQGRLDAAAAGAWLRAQGIEPDRAVVSPALRALETWQLAGGVPEPVPEERVYNASGEQLQEVLTETPATTQVLVLVGHNPGLEWLAWELDDRPEARELTDRGLPTAALAVLEVDGWPLSAARLRELVVPRG